MTNGTRAASGALRHRKSSPSPRPGRPGRTSPWKGEGFWAAALATVVLAGLCGGCGDVKRTECITRANEVLAESLRNDRSEVRALALEAYRDLNRTAPKEELEVILERDLPPARFAAMMARAEQARRTHLRVALLSMARDHGTGGDAGREPFGQAKAVLPRALGSHSAAVRTAALDVYRELQLALAAPPGTSLEKLLDDERSGAALAAMLAEAESRRREELTWFSSALEWERDANVRLAIVYGLARMGDERHMRLLAEGLSDRQASVRRNAAMVLGMLGNRSATGMLKEHLSDSDPVTRMVVAESMAELGNSRGLPTIRAMALGQTEVEPWIQAGAILALGRVGIASQDVDSLRLLEVDGGSVEGSVRLSAFGARGMLGDYSQMSVLAEGASGRAQFDTQSRALALQMLARTSYGPAWRDACAALGAGDPVVRLSAAWAVLAFNNPRADKVIEAVTSPDRPHWLTEEQILRPYRKPTTETESGTTGPLGPIGPVAPLGVR